MNFNQGIIDANKQVTKAFPAANANHNTDTIDFNHTPPDCPPHGSELIVDIPALPNHVDTGVTIVIKLQDSADNSSYADVDPAISTSIVGVASTGTAAKVVRFPIPSTMRRYARLNIAVPTGGGDNTAKSIIVSAVAKQS